MTTSYQTAVTRHGATARGGSARSQSRQNLRQRAGMALVAIAVIIGGVLLARVIRARHHAQLLASLKLVAVKQDRAQLTEAVNSGRITRDEGRALMRDVWAERQQKQMDEYFALPPGDERNRMLDKLIDDREARRKERDARRAAQGPPGNPPGPWAGGPGSAGGPPGTGNGGGPNAAARATRMESIPPASRAQFQQFRYDMNQRLAARGM
ncbi:MAG: hypothetical protein JWN24_601 [Phycisphaerales bacterium]|nr:hypothetical protein [Phycisphaerales bacterium]